MNQRGETVQSGRLTLLVARPAGRADGRRSRASSSSPPPTAPATTAPRGVLADEFRRAGALPTVVDHFRDLVHPEFDRWSRAPLLRACSAGLPRSGAERVLARRSDQRLLAVHAGVQPGGRAEAPPAPARAQRSTRSVSVQPTPAAALSFLRSRGEPIPPHTTVFTDFVAHTQWIHPHVDRYCVPAEEIAHELTAVGLPREGVVVTGIPVACEFLEQPDRAAARLALGLSPRLPVLLFMDGSGGGFGRLEEAARAVLGMEQSVPGRVRGRTRAGSRGAAPAARGGHENRFKVFGFVDHVRELMAAADFLVTKAGGLTLAEALAAELPVICFGSLPGQEARNERFAAMAGVGLVAGSGAQLQRVIAAALRDPVLLRDIRERIGLYRRPRAAEDIVALVLGDQRPGTRARVVSGGGLAHRGAGALGGLHLGLSRADARERLARAADGPEDRPHLRRRPGSRAHPARAGHPGGPRRQGDLLPDRRAGGRGRARWSAASPAAGHDLGNHTWSHRSLWLAGPRETARQVRRGHEAISQAAGAPPRFFRPPWGMTNLALFPVLRRLETPCVFWTVQPEGRRPATPARPGRARATAREARGDRGSSRRRRRRRRRGAPRRGAAGDDRDARRRRAMRWSRSATCCRIPPAPRSFDKGVLQWPSTPAARAAFSSKAPTAPPPAP